MELLTCDQAAKEYGAIPRYIRQEIQIGRLRAQKIGRDWLIKRADFEAWRRSKMQKQAK